MDINILIRIIDLIIILEIVKYRTVTLSGLLSDSSYRKALNDQLWEAKEALNKNKRKTDDLTRLYY